MLPHYSLQPSLFPLSFFSPSLTQLFHSASGVDPLILAWQRGKDTDGTHLVNLICKSKSCLFVLHVLPPLIPSPRSSLFHLCSEQTQGKVTVCLCECVWGFFCLQIISKVLVRGELWIEVQVRLGIVGASRMRDTGHGKANSAHNLSLNWKISSCFLLYIFFSDLIKVIFVFCWFSLGWVCGDFML